MKINAVIYFKTLFGNPDKDHMICSHGYKTEECKRLETITIDIDPKDFLELTTNKLVLFLTELFLFGKKYKG